MRLRSCSIGRLLLCGTLWLGVALVASSARADALYSITGLGTLSGQSSSVATSINNAGQVVGISYNSSDGYFSQLTPGKRTATSVFRNGHGLRSRFFTATAR